MTVLTVPSVSSVLFVALNRHRYIPRHSRGHGSAADAAESGPRR